MLQRTQPRRAFGDISNDVKPNVVRNIASEFGSSTKSGGYINERTKSKRKAFGELSNNVIVKKAARNITAELGNDKNIRCTETISANHIDENKTEVEDIELCSGRLGDEEDKLVQEMLLGSSKFELPSWTPEEVVESPGFSDTDATFDAALEELCQQDIEDITSYDLLHDLCDSYSDPEGCFGRTGDDEENLLSHQETMKNNSTMMPDWSPLQEQANADIDEILKRLLLKSSESDDDQSSDSSFGADDEFWSKLSDIN